MKIFNNNLRNTLKNHLITVYLLTIGFFWISFYLYIRVIKEHKEYSLSELKNSVTPLYILIQTCFLLLHILLVIIAIYTIYNVHYKSVYKKDPNYPKQFLSFGLLKKLKYIVDALFNRPLEYIKNLIAPRIPFADKLYCAFFLFSKKYNLVKHCQIYIIIFNYIPRIIVSLIFFIEIGFYNEVHYFFKSLILLIIPTLWVIFVELLTDRGLRGVKYVQQFCDIEGHGALNSDGRNESYTLHLKDIFVADDIAMTNLKDTWDTSMLLFVFGESYLKLYKTIMDPYVTLLCSSLYLLGITYKLLYLLI